MSDASGAGAVVPQRISLVTLGVRDVGAATRFFRSLGWAISGDSQESVTFLQTSGSALALFGWDDLAEDAHVPAAGSGFRGVSLAINLADEAAVDAAYAAWLAAGATSVKAPTRAFWGGYTCYVADLDGHLWELAYNPGWPIGADGRVQLPA